MILIEREQLVDALFVLQVYDFCGSIGEFVCLVLEIQYVKRVFYIFTFAGFEIVTACRRAKSRWPYRADVFGRN